MIPDIGRRFVACLTIIGLALGIAACDPKHTAKKKAKPKAIITAPKMPRITGRCGIGHAGPAGPNDCHGPYTYIMTAQAAGITQTHVTWRLGPAGAPFDSIPEPVTTSHFGVVKVRNDRVGAAIQIYSTAQSKFAPNQKYGTGCSIAVRDSRGEEVGTDVIRTRPKVAWHYAPYDHADCIWG